MYAKLPPTYELIEALAPAPVPRTRLSQARQWLWRAFVAAVVPTVAAVLAMAVWRFSLGRSLPAWGLPVFLVLLSVCALCYLAALATHVVPLGRAMRNPMRWLSGRMDGDTAVEDALLRRLGRIPPPQLRARQRRVEVELALWEGAARTVTLLLALGPPALLLAGGFVKFAGASRLGAILPVYGAAFVLGGALAVFVQQQCSRPLRRLAHVLAEAAEINERVGRHAPAASSAG